MATRTVRICDRCKAEHTDELGQPFHNVRRIGFEVPLGLSLHGVVAKGTKDLCEPCRKGLHALIQTYLEGPQ